MSRIFIGAQIVPGPAVESAVTHARMKSGTRSSPRSSRSLVEHQRSPVSGCTAKPTQFRSPLANTRRLRPSGSKTSTAARSVSLPQALPTPCDASQRVIAAFLHPLAVVRCRRDGDKHLAAVLGESNVAGDMPALHRAPPGMGKIAYDHLRFARRFEVTGAIWIADHRSRIRDVEPLRIGSRRIES